jgi:hypothetical protein
VRRRQFDADITAAADAIRGKVDQLELQLASTVGPQRAPLVEALGSFNRRLDELLADQSQTRGPELVGFTPAQPVDDGSRRAWVVAALGATVGLGAALSARRTALARGREPEAPPG